MNWLTLQEDCSGSCTEKELSRVGVGGGKSRSKEICAEAVRVMA